MMKRRFITTIAALLFIMPTFAGTYKDLTIEDACAIPFNEMRRDRGNGVFHYEDENMWGGWALSLIEKALEENKDFKNGIITSYLIEGTTNNLICILVQVKNHELVDAYFYIF